MIQRCNNPNNKDYQAYGGRGIQVYEQWLTFRNFLEDMGNCPRGFSLDRIDNNGNYCLENCRWTTRQRQQRNKRNNRTITHKDKTQCVADWSEETGISSKIILWRLNNGWSIEKTLTNPIRRNK